MTSIPVEAYATDHPVFRPGSVVSRFSAWKCSLAFSMSLPFQPSDRQESVQPDLLRRTGVLEGRIMSS